MTKVEIRCTCRRTPLLAVGGRDEKGSPFIQIKQMKSGTIMVHALVTDGTVKIQCRECNRWLRVKIRKDIQSKPDATPPELKHLQEL